MPASLKRMKTLIGHTRTSDARKRRGWVHTRPTLEPLEGRSLPASFIPFPLPATAPPPANITRGPDGNLWFTEPGNLGTPGQIGKVTTAGTFTFYSLPTGASTF